MVVKVSRFFTIKRVEKDSSNEVKKGEIYRTRKSARLHCKSIEHLLTRNQKLIIVDEFGNEELFVRG